jgi:hypothetical protein
VRCCQSKPQGQCWRSNRGQTTAARWAFSTYPNAASCRAHPTRTGLDCESRRSQRSEWNPMHPQGSGGSRPTSKGTGYATHHFGNGAYGICARHIRANIPARRRSQSRTNWRRKLLRDRPRNAVSQRHEQPARPRKLWNSRRAQSMSADAAPAAADLSREPSVT